MLCTMLFEGWEPSYDFGAIVYLTAMYVIIMGPSVFGFDSTLLTSYVDFIKRFFVICTPFGRLVCIFLY